MTQETYEHDELYDDLDLGADEDEEQGMPLGWIVAILCAAAFVGYILFDGFKSETYFYEVDQAVAQGASLIGKTVRIKGIVEEGSVSGEEGSLGRQFALAERGKSLRISYDKALPDTFKEGMEVVAQGTVNEDYVLVANEVLVKCPSRYEGQAPTANAEGTEKAPAVIQ
ncbi:MAG: cytochrome c maturation protein CcmE [Myxococcota bacterium]